MRLIAFILALVASAPAAAQSWQEYSYPDFSFAVAFPAEPKIETVSYRAPDGRAVEARVRYAHAVAVPGHSVATMLRTMGA